MDFIEKNMNYLGLLSKQYPSIKAASQEIINLSAILNLPKGTENFLSDVHGEYESFIHILKNGSGVIRRKIDDIFADSLSDEEKQNLATLIFYPDKRLPIVLKKVKNRNEWYKKTLSHLIQICRVISSKYSRRQVRDALPQEYAHTLEELFTQQEDLENRQEYYQGIIETIISLHRTDDFIIAIAELIQRLSIDRLHVIGDIYDRGPGPHIIMDKLMQYHSVDIQWGNHDILWMGAASGSDACIANAVRVTLRYANMEILEDGYAISLLPLATFALETYANDPCERFKPKFSDPDVYTEKEIEMMTKMHKAISILQFKLEGQVIKRRPHYNMDDRLVLEKIDYEKGTIRIGDKDYELNDRNFPTIDPNAPYTLSEAEKQVMDKLRYSFTHSDKLQKHTRFLFSKGSIYQLYNGNLLYHGCIAMNEDGSFQSFKVAGEEYKAKAFMDRVDRLARKGYFTEEDDMETKLYGMDVMWYLWSGEQSPLYGKDKMATFERYFIDDKETHKETKNPYYQLRDREDIAEKILEEFGLEPESSRIINGHVPVKVKKGESPVKAGGKLIVIDGGFSRAYQSETGIAGYTLIYNSYGFLLASHKPFESQQKAIEEEKDIRSQTKILEKSRGRMKVKDTDKGLEIKKTIKDLKMLLRAYHEGVIKENIA